MKLFISQNVSDPIVEYGDITATVSSEDIPASGGSVNPTVSASQLITYASGKTRLGNLTITKDPTVSASNLGSTLKDRTKIQTWNVQIVGEGGKSVSKSIDIFQEANEIISRDSYSYSGGTSEITASCSRSKTPVYDSGSSGGSTTETATPTLSITGSGFSLSGTTVTADNRSNIAGSTTTLVRADSGGGD